jgi:hypothetical protein
VPLSFLGHSGKQRPEDKDLNQLAHELGGKPPPNPTPDPQKNHPQMRVALMGSAALRVEQAWNLTRLNLALTKSG